MTSRPYDPQADALGSYHEALRAMHASLPAEERERLEKLREKYAGRAAA